MPRRLLVLWLASLVLGLTLLIVMTQGGQDRTGERRAEQTLKVIAENWIDAFQSTLEPGIPLDAMPGLREALQVMARRDAQILDAGLFLPSGQGAATLSERMTAPPELVEGLFGLDSETSLLRQKPVPLALSDADGRFLALPIHDWTGLVRGALILRYAAPLAAWSTGALAWLLQCLVIVTLVTFGLDVLPRCWHRRAWATGWGWILPVALGLVLCSCGLLAAVRKVHQDIDGDLVAVRILAEDLANPPVWWNGRTLQNVSTSLETRVARMATAVPDAVVSVWPAGTMSGRGAIAPVFEVDLQADQGGPGRARRRLTVALDEAKLRTRAISIGLKASLAALVSGLILFQVVPLIGPRSARARTSPARLACDPLIFLAGAATALCWPAFILTAPQAPSLYWRIATAILCLLVQGSVAWLGALLGRQLAQRQGWRSAAKPGLLLGTLASIGTLMLGPSSFLGPALATMGFAAGLAAAGLFGLRRWTAPMRIRGFVGPVAGVALGLLLLQASHTAMAALAASAVLWLASAAICACLPNDDSAALRFIVRRLDARDREALPPVPRPESPAQAVQSATRAFVEP